MRTLFFAVEDDLQQALLRVEDDGALAYARIGYTTNKAIEVFDSVSEIGQLSEATDETGSHSRSFLVGHEGTTFRNEKIKRYDGSVVYSVYEALNPDCVRIIPAGRWNDMVLYGTLVAFHRDAQSKKLMRRIKASFKKSGFEKIHGYWLGPEAKRLFNEGVRFGGAEQSPPEYDFRPPA